MAKPEQGGVDGAFFCNVHEKRFTRDWIGGERNTITKRSMWGGLLRLDDKTGFTRVTVILSTESRGHFLGFYLERCA